MRIAICGFLSLCLAIAANAQAFDGQPRFVGHFYNYIGKTRYSSVVTSADLDETPKWDESQAEPPLAPRQAVLAARQCLEKLKLPIQQWEVDLIALLPAGEDSYWLYDVTFSEFSGRGSAGKLQRFSIIVLMNGRAVVPREEP